MVTSTCPTHRKFRLPSLRFMVNNNIPVIPLIRGGPKIRCRGLNVAQNCYISPPLLNSYVKLYFYTCWFVNGLVQVVNYARQMVEQGTSFQDYPPNVLSQGGILIVVVSFDKLVVLFFSSSITKNRRGIMDCLGAGNK